MGTMIGKNHLGMLVPVILDDTISCLERIAFDRISHIHHLHEPANIVELAKGPPS